MELALELVNHVPPEIADRLLGKLRDTEEVKDLAESRCSAAKALIEQAAMPDAKCSFLERLCRKSLCILAFLLLMIGLLIFMLSASGGMEVTSATLSHWLQQNSIIVQLRKETAAVLQSSCPALPMRHGPAELCEEMLREVWQGNEELRREDKGRSDDYAHILAAMGQLNSFLLHRRDMTINGEPFDVGAACIEAARPGQAALLDLVQNFAVRQAQLSEQLSARKFTLNATDSPGSSERASGLSVEKIGDVRSVDHHIPRSLPLASAAASAIISWVERTW